MSNRLSFIRISLSVNLRDTDHSIKNIGKIISGDETERETPFLVLEEGELIDDAKIPSIHRKNVILFREFLHFSRLFKEKINGLTGPIRR